jgi:sugar phosphate isomerase/epimerase
MPVEPVLLSAFSDEAAPQKTPEQQFSVMAALGLQYVSIRFVDCGQGIKNVLQLDSAERKILKTRLADFGLQVSSIGSPLGKIKIADFEDGTQNRFLPFDRYLDEDVARAIEAACALECKLIRGFSFYYPRGSDVTASMGQSIDQIGRIVERCDESGLTFGLEVEANLVGHTGYILREIHAQINHAALMLVFDGGNLVTQGFSAAEILDQFRAMLPGLGWMHVKDYARAASKQPPGTFVDEDALDRFVPADRGAAGHIAIFDELTRHRAAIETRLKARGVQGFFVDLEPHLRGGGQFGGFSGPDGMGIAFRALCRLLESTNIEYELRGWPAGGLPLRTPPA